MRPIESVYPVDQYEYVPKVAIFRTHRRTKNGKQVEVGRKELQEIADNHNSMWEQLGRAAPFSKGHTLDAGPDGGEVKEEDQPDTIGAGLGLFIEAAPDEPDGHILYCTWALPKAERSALKSFVAVSPEYHPSRRLLWPIAALKTSTPELMLPPFPARYTASGSRVRYGLELPAGELPYRLLLSDPFRHSLPSRSLSPSFIASLNAALH